MRKVKKIKKIPKYFDGTQSIAAIKDPIKTIANESGNAALSAPLKQPDALTKYNAQQMSNALNKNYGTSPSGGGNGTAAAGGSGFGGRWGQFGAAATAGGKMLMNTFGVKDNSSAGVTLNKSMEGAEIGGAIMPGWGHLIGGVAGGLIGGFSGAKFDKSLASTTGNAADWVTHGGIFNDNYDEKVREASMYQNSLMAAEQTANKQLEWANDPRNQSMTFNAKDGGIVPDVVHAKLSKGELYYDPYTKTLSRVPGSPNKPNTNDDVDAFVKEGGMIIPNSENQPLLNGKTQAIALAPMIDKPGKKMSEGTIAARDAIVRKTVRRNEMAKLNKPENRNKILYASDGDIVPYSYNKDMSQFEYWDKDKNDYKKEYIDWVNSLTDQDVKDIYSGKYGDMSTYLGKNKDYIPTVELARMLMTDKKYGDWHKIAKAAKTQMDSRIAPVRLSKEALDKATPTYNDSPWYTEDGQMRWNLSKFGNKNIIKSDPYKKPFDWNGLMDTIADYAPLVAAYANKPKWDVESASTWIPEYVPVAVDKANQIRAIKDVINTSKYNIRNISPNTGAYMAYASNAASQAAKQYADIYTDKTNEEFARIAHNAGIHNQWAPQIAAAIDQAKANTQANKAAAYAQRDVNIKDTMSYLRDQQMLPFLEQYLSSGAYNSSIKKLV